MKELHSLYTTNIKLAKKLEDIGLYSEADKVDRYNLIISSKLVLAKAPPPGVDPTTFGQFTRLEPYGAEDIVKKSVPDKNFKFKEFLKGVSNAIKIASGKTIDLSKYATIAGLGTALSKIIGYGTVFYNIYEFFLMYSQDQSGQVGDSPQEVAKIFSNLSALAGGILTVASASGGGAVTGALSAIAYIIAFILNIYAGGLEDELDYNKKSYPGKGKDLLQDAFEKVIKPNATFESYQNNLTPAQIRAIKDKIGEIVKKGNFKASDALAAFAIIDTNLNSQSISRKDFGSQYGLGKKPQKTIPKDMRGFDVPFTP